MKKIYFIATLITLLGAAADSYANQVCEDHMGSLHCGAGTMESLHYRGFVDMTGTHVLNECKVNGNVDIREAELNQVDIRGVSYLNNTTISGDLKIVGNVTARDSHLLSSAKLVGNVYGSNMQFNGVTHIVGLVKCDKCTFSNSTTLIGDIVAANTNINSTLTVNAKSSVFSNSNILDIYVKEPSDNETQTISLTNHSVVRNIIFASGKGKVMLDHDSVISGRVQGGNIIKN